MAINHSRSKSAEPAETARCSTSDRAQELFRAAFGVPRDPRSQAYKAGVLAVLRYRCAGANGDRVVCPYAAETAECDAFFAGCAEGHAIWRAQKDGAP